MRYERTDYEWTAIKPFLPNKPRGVPRVNDRRVLNGIFWVLRSGAPWRDLPETFGPYTTCYNRFVRWGRAGVWDQIMDALAAMHDAAVQMIDTSIVRVHQHGACVAGNNQQHMGRSRGGLTTKIHAVVDTNGLPVQIGLTPGETHDNQLCSVLLSELRPQTMLLADRGYDADWIRAFASDQGAWANIPPKRNRKEAICFSPYLYRGTTMFGIRFSVHTEVLSQFMPSGITSKGRAARGDHARVLRAQAAQPNGTAGPPCRTRRRTSCRSAGRRARHGAGA